MGVKECVRGVNGISKPGMWRVNESVDSSPDTQRVHCPAEVVHCLTVKLESLFFLSRSFTQLKVDVGSKVKRRKINK